MHDFYTTLIDVGYYSRKDMVFPPHSINNTLCLELHVDPTGIEVIENIPFPCTEQASQISFILHDSRTLVFTDDEHLLISRDPTNGDWSPEERRLDYLSPWELPLTMRTAVPGKILLLSVRENTIRKLDVWAPSMKLKDRHGISVPRPDEPLHYLNNLPRPATDVIKEHIKKVRTLEVIPIADGRRGTFVGRDQDP